MIKIENLEIKYNDEVVLTDLNLEIETGDFVRIFGENGSGKSSLIYCMLFKNNTYNGEIYIDDINVKDKKDWKDIGYLAQKININHDIPITVKEYLLLYKSNNDKLKTLILEFDLEKILGKKINDLSGGQFQRVNIVKVLSQNIKYLFLDEPDNNLDIQKQREFYKMLEKINESGITIVMISHNVSELNIANKLYNIKTKQFERS